jgi:hypothetical protein
VTIDEVISGTPNGFHDAYLLNISVDYRERTLQIGLNWWIGDLSSEVEEVRESYREGRFIVTGLQYFVVESPANGSLTDEPSYIDGFETRASDVIRASLPDISSEAIRYSFFVGDWNSFIHFAGTSAKVLPTDFIVRRTEK